MAQQKIIKMPKVILKTATTANDNKISQLTTGELAIVTNSTGPRVAFKDENNTVVYLTPIEDLEYAIWNLEEETGSTILNGFKFNKTGEDSIRIIGDFSYSSVAASNGGTLTPTNTLKLLKNGIQQTVTFTYSSNQSYASVDNTGKVTFTSHTNTSIRTATITAKCIYNGQEYSKTTVATQSAYVPDVINITGTFTYNGNAASTGGTVNINSNTLKLKKNNVEQTGVSFAFSLTGNPSYATINASTGAVTFQNNTGALRSVNVVAKCTYEGKSYTSSTVTVSQAAYVAPTEYLYAGGCATWDPTMNISAFNEVKNQVSTNKAFTFTIDGYNIIGIVYPTNMSIKSAKTGELDEDITSTLNTNTTTVTYKDKSMKLSQIKFDAGTLSNQNFTIIFN